ncbi:hypothetical protein ADUPG1_003965, partial [Aduncisulcus paluster]
MKVMRSLFAEGLEIAGCASRLPQIQFLLNTHVHRELGVSPHEMIYGKGILVTYLKPWEVLKEVPELDT